MQENRGSKASIQWLIKTETDKQLGPYSTEAVLKLISEGALTGSEKIKRYPDGKWTAISRQPDFYDKLLEALEEIPKFDPRDQEKFEAETVIAPLPQKNQEDFERTIIVPRNTQSTPAVNEESFTQETFKPSLENDQRNPNSVALTPALLMGKKKKNGKKTHANTNAKDRSTVLFVCVVMGLLAGIYVFLFDDDPNVTGVGNGKPHLIVPRASSKATMAAADVKTGIQKAVSDYVRDTYESYLESQKKLVDVIEGAPQSVDAKGTLCLVYKELWPYVRQDSRDLDAIYAVSKATRSLDPTGINGIYCEVVKLMILGKYKEARGVVDFALNQPQMSTAPVLYQLKAELLFEERDLKTAIVYAEKALQLWPEWIKPYFDLGRYLAKADQGTESAQALQQTLQKNPKHKMAQIEYGILLFAKFKQAEDALKILITATSTPGKLTGVDLARAHFFLGLIYADKKDFPRAKDHAQRAFQYNPSDAKIKELVAKLGGSTQIGKSSAENNELVFLGDQHQRTGNCLAAQAEYKTAFELDPTNAMAALKAAKCLWQLNQGNEAIQWLRKAVKSDPKFVTAYVLLADYQSAQFDYLAATQTLMKASKLFQNNHEVLRGYGLVEFRRNNTKDAIAYLQRAYKIYENDIDVLILLAKAQSLAGDYTAAQKYAVRAIELDATNTEAQIIYSRILTQFQGLETGLLYLRDLINKFSYTIEFRLALADLYREQERANEAQKIYEQIVDADPRNKAARLGLGQTYQIQAQFDKALKQFLSASVIDPSDPEGLFKAGILYMDISKYAEAIKQFKRAQTVNPLYPRLNYYIGRAYFQNNQAEEALQAAMAERKINPNLADSYVLAAEVYAESKQFQKCSGEYQNAVKLRPQGADLYVKMARCYRQSGSADIAESMLNIAATQESGLPEIYKEQGAVYEVKGDRRAAAQAYNKYLALSPNAPDRKEIESRILAISSGN